MTPYSIVRDEARVVKLEPSGSPYTGPKRTGVATNSSLDFLSYVDELLEGRSAAGSGQNQNGLQPSTGAPGRRLSNSNEAPMTCKDAIDLAILRSNLVTSSARSPNRFEIARNGRRIAVIVLNRPAHRLGETVIATVEFAGAALPCYALRASLESSERVAPALAVRSDASIRRATRKVHAAFLENTLYATRVVVSPAIPISATPSVYTTGINVEWELRFEFVTPSAAISASVVSKSVVDSSAPPSPVDEAGPRELPPRFPSGAGLLEPLSRDDRGVSLASLENLACESFEISIPLTVYGETVREMLPEENEGYSI